MNLRIGKAICKDDLLEFIMWLDDYYYISIDDYGGKRNPFEVLDEYLQFKKEEQIAIDLLNEEVDT